MIELRTLGALDLRDTSDGHEVRSVAWQSKRMALLVYLSMAARHGFHRRDELLPIFWPEADEERARHALSQALYVLHRSLSEGLLESRGEEEIRLDPTELWCDAAAFEDALDAGKTAQAFELYGGELLPGFHLPGCPQFEHWLDRERGHLRERAVQAAWSLAEEQEAAGHGVQAAYLARRAVQWAPYDEILIRRLIELLTRLGDRAGAVAEYEAFARRLASDLDLAPSEETQSLVRSVRSAKVPPGPPADVRAAAEAEPTASRTLPESVSKGRARRWVALWIVAAVIPTVALGWIVTHNSAVRAPDAAPAGGIATALERPRPPPTSSRTAYEHVERVRELLRTAHYSDDDSVKRASLDKAQQLAAKAIELDPNYADAYGYLGVLYMRRGQYGWGEAWFDSADALAKSLMTRGPRERGHAHWIQGDLAWRLRRWTEGADHLEKAAGLLRDEVELQSQAALAHYLLGNFDKSFVFWRRGAALDPQRPDPCRAGSYFHLDLLDEAEACSRRLLEIDYNDSWGFRVLVKTYIAQGRDLEAQQLLQRTPPLLFDRSLYLSNLAGDVALIMGDHGRAREYYERGLARNRNGISSGVWVARTSLAHILWKAGERDSARVLLEESEAYDWDRLEKRPMRWGWYYDLAAVHAIRGDKEKAHRYLRAAFDAGWHWFRLGLRDPRLKSIRADDRFRLLMAEVEDSVAAMRSRVPKDLLASGLADKE